MIFGNLKYKVLNDLIIKDKFIVKPNSFTSYASQGVCCVGTNILITSYDTLCDEGIIRSERKNSILDIVNEDGSIKYLLFDNKYHVGGIGYNKEYNRVFVCANKCINSYEFKYINSLHDGDILLNYNDYDISVNISNASYLTVYNNVLYVGEFKKFGKSRLIKYIIDKDELIMDKTYYIPYSKIQGICVCTYNYCVYYFFSSSYGRKFSSMVYVTKLIDNKFVEIFRFEVPCMAEQISFDNDGNLMIIFESDCLKYIGLDGKGKSINQVDKVCFLDISKIFNG